MANVAMTGEEFDKAERLYRETLDADQVRRICAGQPLDEYVAPTGSATPAAPRDARPAKDRPAAIVPPLSPPRPVTQE